MTNKTDPVMSALEKARYFLYVEPNYNEQKQFAAELGKAIAIAEQQARVIEVAHFIANRWTSNGLGRGDEYKLNELCAELRKLAALMEEA